MKPTIVALIRENECIGCTKCMEVCPVDAILGSHQLMHTVIATECIGCKLCIPPCPVDCIAMIEAPTTQTRAAKKKVTIQRFQARKKRLRLEETAKIHSPLSQSFTEKREYIQAAILRVKKRKQGKNC